MLTKIYSQFSKNIKLNSVCTDNISGQLYREAHQNWIYVKRIKEFCMLTQTSLRHV